MLHAPWPPSVKVKVKGHWPWLQVALALLSLKACSSSLSLSSCSRAGEAWKLRLQNPAFCCGKMFKVLLC